MLADGTVEAFRLQAQFCPSYGSPLYADLLTRAAADIDAGGPVAALLDGWQGRPTPDALPLRLMGGVHRLVLDGGAPSLAEHYPSAGGTPRGDATWDAFRAVVATRADVLRPALDRQVQTNEVRRSAALLSGFLTVAARTALPLRIREIGSSAGLNLLWDRYRYALPACAAETPPADDAPLAHTWGDPGAAVTIRSGWHGSGEVFTGQATVASRAGCDIAPIDVTDPEQARTLESFIWADQVSRLTQLRAAIAAARREPPPLVRRAAADWLDEELATAPDGVATVVFHSIMWWYLSEPERDRATALLHAAGARATPHAPLAWLRFDLFGSPTAEVRLILWPGGEETTLATADAHGRWVTWRGR
ncbi:MAG: DUF2332 domain-containing protein [Deltaproteobacteria bacterium]|nr:DUF2332 domain-containing protein [Deltaproteobacteria bacterium]